MLSPEQQEAARVAIPSLDTAMQYVWQRLAGLHPLEAGLLLVPLGLVFLLYGFRLYKWLVSVVFAGIGASVGAALALAGAAGLALGSRPSTGNPGGNMLLGDLYGVITAFAYAGYLLAVERARTTSSALQVTLASTAVAMLITGAVALFFGENFWPASGTGWAVLVGLALLVHVLGQGGIIWALGQLPASLSSVVILIQPVVAAGLGWLWLGEGLGWLDAVFAGLVLTGVLIARRQ